jgi:hypothetical protein
MQINKREATFLITALETQIEKNDLYISKIESGDIPNHDPSSFELSKSFQKERRELLDKLTRFCEE